jgi:O-antigen/teichoic acid export membrane protein
VGLLKAEQLVLHNVVVGGGTIAAGLLGVAFQSLVSHQLRPADYGAVFAVVTLITFIGMPASAFTLLMARETSKGRASGHHAVSATLLRRGNRALMLLGTAAACTMALGSPELGRFLNVPVELIISAAFGVPFALALPLLLGEFQGEQRFVAFSVLMTGQAGVKLLAAIALGVVFGPLGVVAGISLATITVYLIALSMLRKRLAISAHVPWLRPSAKYLIVVLPSALSLAVLLSADVLLAKHFFPARVAGEYASVAALGRAIFWGASGVAAVLFPKVVFRTSQGNSGSRLVGASLVLVLLGGLAGLTVLSMTSVRLLSVFAGGAYVGAASYLVWYAVGMMFLGGVAVLVASHQSHGRPGFLLGLVPLTVLEPALIVGFHRDPLQVVQVLDLSVAIVFASLAAMYLAMERSRRSPAPAVASSGADQQIVELVSRQ